MADLTTTIQRAVRRDSRSLYRVARDANVHYAALHRFMSGERPNIRIDTAEKLCRTLRLELKARR